MVVGDQIFCLIIEFLSVALVGFMLSPRGISFSYTLINLQCFCCVFNLKYVILAVLFCSFDFCHSCSL
jgi:hypothetical protein